MIDRAALRLAYRPDENVVVRERVEQAKLSAAQQGEASAIARTLVKAVRGHKAAGLDAFLQAYDLGSDEGIALMCLAEALLRIPDAETADEDLRELLSQAAATAPPPAGALLFTCNGRGMRLFPAPDHDAGCLQSTWANLPMAGFFAQGELGPIGKQNCLHGFTASVALFDTAD